jgi:hypothetical protein
MTECEVRHAFLSKPEHYFYGAGRFRDNNCHPKKICIEGWERERESIYVCVCVSIYIYIHIHINKWYTHTHICLGCVWVYLCLYMCVNACVCMQVCMYLFIFLCVRCHADVLGPGRQSVTGHACEDVAKNTPWPWPCDRDGHACLRHNKGPWLRKANSNIEYVEHVATHCWYKPGHIVHTYVVLHTKWWNVRVLVRMLFKNAEHT